MDRTPNFQSTSTPNRLLRAGGKLMLPTLAAVTLAACTSDGQETNNTLETPVNTTIEAPTSTASLLVEPTSTTEAEVSAYEYLEDPERQEGLQELVTQVGTRIVEAAQSGELGYFDFYNGEKDEWHSKTPDTTGWGSLQHNPQYGGSESQVMVDVYRNPDGTYDLSKGIKSVFIDLVEEGRSTVVSIYDVAGRLEANLTTKSEATGESTSTRDFSLAGGDGVTKEDIENFDTVIASALTEVADRLLPQDEQSNSN